MKKLAAGVLVTFVLFSFIPSGFAHDGWSQTNTPIIEPGEVSYVELLFGNHSNDHASYRIDGTWNAEDTDVMVTTPGGERVDISDTLFYTGEVAEDDEDKLGVNNYYVGSFSTTEPGLYTISAERDSIFSYGDSASRTLRSAKSFVAVSEIPLVSAAEEFEGYDEQVTPDRAELIPLFNPAAITPGEDVSVQLLQEGEPLADSDVSLIRRSTSEAESFTTNDEGMITFTSGPADYYLLRAMPSTDEGIEAEAYDSVNYEATMTFAVQNGDGLRLDELGTLVTERGLADIEAVAEPTTEVADLFSNPFFYASIVLGLGFIGTLMAFLRK